MRERQLVRGAWSVLVQPLQRGLWAYQQALLRKAFLALRAAPTVKAALISGFWLHWRVRKPLQRCCSSIANAGTSQTFTMHRCTVLRSGFFITPVHCFSTMITLSADYCGKNWARPLEDESTSGGSHFGGLHWCRCIEKWRAELMRQKRKRRLLCWAATIHHLLLQKRGTPKS